LFDEDFSVRNIGNVLSHLAVKVRNKGGGAKVVGVVKADIVTCFLLRFECHFLNSFFEGWDGFAVVSNMGTDKICVWLSIYSFHLDLWKYFQGYIISRNGTVTAIPCEMRL